jgi:hypothetical protein
MSPRFAAEAGSVLLLEPDTGHDEDDDELKHALNTA